MTAEPRRALKNLVAGGAGDLQNDEQRIKLKGFSDGDLNRFLDSVYTTWGNCLCHPIRGNCLSPYSVCINGGCQMGNSEDEGLVDENGESWMTEEHVICDGSVLPSAVDINPI
ncbi:hypothetical protein Ancab_030172 [Ancistrocladus abbreviatus]